MFSNRSCRSDGKELIINSKDVELKRRRSAGWRWVMAWTIFIYVSAFYAVPLAREMFTYLNMNALMGMIFGALVLTGAVIWTIKTGCFQVPPKKRVLMFITLIVFIVAYWTAERHAKRFHLIEYSVLAYLFYRVLRLDFKGARLWLFAFLGALLVGLGDEILQRWIPERVSSWPDLFINIQGALFGLIFPALTVNKTGNDENRSL